MTIYTLIVSLITGFRIILTKKNRFCQKLDLHKNSNSSLIFILIFPNYFVKLRILNSKQS